MSCQIFHRRAGLQRCVRLAQPFSQCVTRSCATAAPEVPAKPMSAIPGPRNLPGFGTLPDFVRRAGYKLQNPDLLAIHEGYYNDYGDVYRLNMPPFGEHVVITDPREFLPIFQTEGKYPRGSAGLSWPFAHYHEKTGNETIKDIMEDGEPWLKYRRKLNPDLFNAKVAKEYLPAISEAARLACATAPDFTDRFDEWISRLSFDMFCALALGRMVQTADEAVAKPEDIQFVRDAMTGFSCAGRLTQEPHRRYFGGGLLDEFMGSMKNAQDRGSQMVEQLWDEIQAGGDVGEFVESSCMARLIRRGELNKEELNETLFSFLMAGVDTTSYVTGWLLINLASNPDKQERLRAELQSVLDGKDLDAASLPKLPYLKACLRESHRVTPPAPFAAMRPTRSKSVIGGYEIPEGTYVLLNATKQKGPAYFPEDHGSFNPDRWLPEAVASRKGTEAAVADHQFLAAPFSFGARMCLGARVAKIEMLAATSRLLQDYRLELEPGQTWKLELGLFLKADPFPKFRLTPVRS